MKRWLFLWFCIIIHGNVISQKIDPGLLQVKESLDRVLAANASVTLELDIDFINMPAKFADLRYQKGKPIKHEADNFIIIPKRGLDFSWNELFRYDFMTVNRGNEKKSGVNLKVLNVIPLDKRADFAIMTLKIDTAAHTIREADITTKNNGSYGLSMEYEDNFPFPSQLIVSFEIEKIKIPLKFMGDDAEVDKEQLKSDDLKTGSILLTLDWYAIELSGDIEHGAGKNAK
jgi:hypothetical protein